MNVENCWDVFKKNNSIFCNIFAESAGDNKPQILNPSIGNKMRLYLCYDRYHDFSVDTTTNYTQAAITDVTKHSDFMFYLLGDPSWTERYKFLQDVNYKIRMNYYLYGNYMILRDG
jgi:hypothetical protein